MILEFDDINLKSMLRVKPLESWTLQDFLFFYDLDEQDRLFIQGTRQSFQFSNALKDLISNNNLIIKAINSKISAINQYNLNVGNFDEI